MKIETVERQTLLARRLRGEILKRRGTTSILSLCQLVGVSETLCRKIFVAAFHETPGKFARRVRLENALTALSSNKDSIETTAYESGFGSQTGFGRSLKAQFGCTPTQFRYLNPDPVSFPSTAYTITYGSAMYETGVRVAEGRIVTYCYAGQQPIGRIGEF